MPSPLQTHQCLTKVALASVFSRTQYVFGVKHPNGLFCVHQRKVFLTKCPFTTPTEMPGKILEPPLPEKNKIIYAQCCLHCSG